jgi:hypothetical protein
VSNPVAKRRVLALRKQGLSLKEIAKKTSFARSSISLWAREIVLSRTQQKRLKMRMIAGGHAGRLKGAEWNRQQRLQRLALFEKQAKGKIQEISSRNLFFLGLGLYWGEGFKAPSTPGAGFSNSDYRVVLLMITWFEKCLGVARDRFRIQIFVNDLHRDREVKILRFWKEKTGLSSQQFLRVIFLQKSRKVYENRDSYYGVCAVRVQKGRGLKDSIVALIQQAFEVYESTASMPV